MRVKRIKIKGIGTYYHLVNHTAGCKGELLFNEEDKAFGINLIFKLCQFYCLEVISACWMSNHFHIILFAPPDPPTIGMAAAKYNKHYNLHPGHNNYLDSKSDPEKCELIAQKLIDISHFMKCLQQSFSIYYNKTYHRQGPLWKERFWSTVLQGSKALWDCVLYVELNPVRANLTAVPELYEYCSWGVFKKTGKHPFHDSFLKHMGMNQSFKPRFRNCKSNEQIFQLFSMELLKILKSESKITSEEYVEKIEEAFENNEVLLSKHLFKIKHWSRGLVIGTDKFVKQVANDFFKNISTKKNARGVNSQGHDLLIFHRGNSCI